MSVGDSAAGQIILYRRPGSEAAIEVRLTDETVWLSQQQIAELFQSSRTNIVEHIGNIYLEGELQEAATCRKSRQVRTEGSRQVSREVSLYSLDLILSVGYRVRSKTATQFRIWATDRLREFLVQGYAVNERRIAQLGSIVQVLSRSDDELISGVADVLAEYLPGLTLLRDYDEGTLAAQPTVIPSWTLTADEAREVIRAVAVKFPDDELLGRERGGALDGIIGAIYQGFGGQDLYSTVEEKAANLLYLMVKDHPLADGNKRCAAALFVMFLARNGIHSTRSGTARISNNALTAVTLMVAMSDPKEKEVMVALLMRMLADDPL